MIITTDTSTASIRLKLSLWERKKKKEKKCVSGTDQMDPQFVGKVLTK